MDNDYWDANKQFRGEWHKYPDTTPPTSGEYLVTMQEIALDQDDGAFVSRGNFYLGDLDDWYDEDDCDPLNDGDYKVVAWMPLPQPYREER